MSEKPKVARGNLPLKTGAKGKKTPIVEVEVVDDSVETEPIETRPIVEFRKTTENAEFPQKNGDGSFDLIYTDAETAIPEGMTIPLMSGIEIRIPKGYIGIIAPRRKHLYAWAYSAMTGIIHAREEFEEAALVITALANFTIKPGDRIANLVVFKVADTIQKEIDYTPEDEKPVFKSLQSAIERV